MPSAAAALSVLLLSLQVGTTPPPHGPPAEPFRTPISQHLPAILGELRLVAVGDIMMHQDVKEAAAQAQGGFPQLWADLVPLFKGADVAFANLETPVAPASGKPGRPYQFNAPVELPGALRASGFTVLSTANNHAFDQGSAGVKETLQRLREERLLAVGSGDTQTEAEQIRILERNGVRIAFLGFTDFFNLDLNRKGSEPWVRPLDLEPALAAVAEARKGADAVVVSLHWGDEYSHQPTKRHREVAEALVAGGADLLVGHHPHVLQPAELVEKGGRTGIVLFSLGNFISNQDRMYRADLFPVAAGDNRDGAAFFCTFSKVRLPDGTVKVILGEVGYEPLWTENNWRERARGQAKTKEIRVIRVKAAIERTRRELDELCDPREGARRLPDDKARKVAILEKQEYLRTLLLRKARVASIVGGAFELR
ncbi:MAG: CapA family protein [Acidobacteria bacterium]|nr:CapA family protein [Acidobacteriota bacterium]